MLRCALGRGGVSARKREGDGATPLGTMRPTGGYFRADRVKRPPFFTALSPIRADDGWCDAPGDPNYNRPVRLPIKASHEKMMRADRLYDICLVLDWNREPGGRKRYGGSAIFLHAAKPGYLPTEGCIALDPRDLRWLLPRLGRRTTVRVTG